MHDGYENWNYLWCLFTGKRTCRICCGSNQDVLEVSWGEEGNGRE